ncbi:MAG: 4-(cytidine 5'-diphospho)-2-C-methyl-D-erythritol kinase [Hyphomicrobiales bacterium]|nr:MAG: 4-(cytidine 5'-diphospho)-2-C-methyl-D-erythritol kinase [Hyphomicrobiales bacterium]
MITIEARAKVNLALHITGRRADGYHLLDSLVVFPEIGDWIAAEPDRLLSLRISGPFGNALDDGPSNLVLQAARRLAEKASSDGHTVAGARIVLDKHLPVASGIGGGSADAAATLTALCELWSLPYRADDLGDLTLSLGADVPMCMAGVALKASGIGEIVEPVAGLPAFHMVLVNPGVAVSTPAVFTALAKRDNSPLPALPASFDTAAELASFLATCRNDLEAPARALEPVIGDVLDALVAAPDCLIARMSGSGATCFGLFTDEAAAGEAAARIASSRSDWWIRSGPVSSRTSPSCD